MKILIIFGSEVGTTKYVSEVMKQNLSERGHEVTLYQVGVHGMHPPIQDYEVLLIGSPTYYGGNLEQKMASFVTKFKPKLSSYKIGIFGLGDSGYEHFCGAATLLEQWVGECGGTPQVTTLKIDGFPHNTGMIKDWTEEICKL